MAERNKDPRTWFVPRILPWLLFAAMLAVYGITLNHWVSFTSLLPVTKITGWWLPEINSPLLFLVTGPFRWMPPGMVPVAVNLFAAVCAAGALGLLARSVAILPQDRTEAQRKREQSDFSFLTLRSAWLPPLLAVLVCGLQLTFWEQATNFTGETFDLLIFAFLVWSLLEYRLDEREGRLVLAALVYGASMAENWAMVAFFPVFLAALIWLRGWHFFEWRFLRKLIVAGVLGLSAYLILPLMAVFSGDGSISFWQTLRFNLTPQLNVLKSVFLLMLHPMNSAEFLSVVLAYLLPLFVLSLRWKPSFGDRSNLGAGLTSVIFHLVHAAFLLMLVWIAFDPPFGPRHINTQSPMLTIYYLGALSIGYYCGYFLLVFGKREISRRPKKKTPLDSLNPVIVAAVWLFAAVAVAGLVYRNGPQVRTENGDTLWQYARMLSAKLPARGGYLMSDDPQRLAFVQAALRREGRGQNFVPLETQSLVVPSYHRFLHQRFPTMWPEIVSANKTATLNPLGLIQVLARLSQTNDIDYLHPSYGYYFEQFYGEPHGLAYKLKLLPEDTLLPPKADKELIAENEAFWSQEARPAIAAVEKAIAPVDPNAPRSFPEKVLRFFHIERDQDQNAVIAGIYYSRSVNAWGVELQRAGELERAAGYFQLATNLNPDNVVARVNLEFNQRLRAGKPATIDLSTTTSDQFGRFGTWNDLLNVNGPFDEPSFCFRNGEGLANDNGLYRQSIAQLQRVRELLPDFLPARYELARIYLTTHLPDRALEALQDPLSQPERFSLGETNQANLNVLVAAAYFQKNENARGARLIETEMARHPDDEALRNIAAQVFMARGMFSNALSIVDRKLKASPDEPTWLYNRGYICIQLKRYDDAIAALSRVLAVQPDNNNALFNRAIAYLNSNQLDAARKDYQDLQQRFTNSIPVAYGLAEIAWRQHDNPEAIRNYEIYLANANTNTTEARTVLERLHELKK